MRSAVLAAALALLGCDAEPPGVECTLVGCDSTLTVTLAHDLDLSAGPYRLEVDAPGASLRCSFGPAPSAEDETCFGYRFADLAWDADTVTLTLLELPSGPDAGVASLPIRVFQGGELLHEVSAPLDVGPPLYPNGPGCPPVCWTATASATLP